MVSELQLPQTEQTLELLAAAADYHFLDVAQTVAARRILDWMGEHPQHYVVEELPGALDEGKARQFAVDNGIGSHVREGRVNNFVRAAGNLLASPDRSARTLDAAGKTALEAMDHITAKALLIAHEALGPSAELADEVLAVYALLAPFDEISNVTAYACSDAGGVSKLLSRDKGIGALAKVVDELQDFGVYLRGLPNDSSRKLAVDAVVAGYVAFVGDDRDSASYHLVNVLASAQSNASDSSETHFPNDLVEIDAGYLSHLAEIAATDGGIQAATRQFEADLGRIVNVRYRPDQHRHPQLHIWTVSPEGGGETRRDLSALLNQKSLQAPAVLGKILHQFRPHMADLGQFTYALNHAFPAD